MVDGAGDFLDLLGGTSRSITDFREPENSTGIVFATEMANTHLSPCQVQSVALGSPAHILECVRFGDEVKAVDYNEVTPATLLRLTKHPDVTGRRLVLTILR